MGLKIRFLGYHSSGVQGNKLLEDEVSPKKPPYLDLQNKHTLEWLYLGGGCYRQLIIYICPLVDIIGS
jgi:hypothetical protein